MNDDDRITAATAKVKAAFAPGATAEEMAEGEHILSSLLAALRGAIGTSAGSQPSASTTSSDSAPTTEASFSAATRMLETVIHFLKEQLDEEDRAAIESEAPPFSVPFINNLQGA